MFRRNATDKEEKKRWQTIGRWVGVVTPRLGNARITNESRVVGCFGAVWVITPMGVIYPTIGQRS